MWLPIDKLSDKNLEARANYHREESAHFARHRESNLASESWKLAQIYQDELNRRALPTDLEVWDDPDR